MHLPLRQKFVCGGHLRMTNCYPDFSPEDCTHFLTWVNIWRKPLPPLTWLNANCKHFFASNIFPFDTFSNLSGTEWTLFFLWLVSVQKYINEEALRLLLIEQKWSDLPPFLMKTLKFLPSFLHLNNIWWSSNQGVNFFNVQLVIFKVDWTFFQEALSQQSCQLCWQKDLLCAGASLLRGQKFIGNDLIFLQTTTRRNVEIAFALLKVETLLLAIKLTFSTRPSKYTNWFGSGQSDAVNSS